MTKKTHGESLKELQTVPGIGRSISQDLYDIGVTSIADLAKREPDELYEASNRFAGVRQDPCLLYTFRCAVYYARGGRDKEKLKWWNWK